MKISDKKIAANKANSLKSKGPKTDQGKDKSKFNAVKHGAYATTEILPGEDESIFLELKDEQCRLYRPKTFVEKALVGQLINELWTLRRIASAESIYFATTRADLESAKQISLSAAESEFMERGRDLQEKDVTTADKRMVIKLRKKLNRKRLDQVYNEALVFDTSGYTQKLIQMKRGVLQSILAIESQLEGRSQRRNSIDILKSNGKISWGLT